MSNQSTNLCNYRSVSFCTPFLTPLKPYATARRPFFPFQHKLVSIGRRSRRKSSSLPLTPAAQLSSDLVLIATTEHRDGSLVFRFGDASEVVKNVDTEKEIENQIEQESSVVKILDGDQDKLVEGRLIEVVDGIRNADINSDIVESETNGIRVLKDSYAESSEILSDVSEKEVLLSEFDAKMNDSLIVAENSDPTIYLLDDSSKIDKNEDPEGTVLEGSDDKTLDPLASVELESAQVSQIGAINDFEKVETEDNRKSDTEDIVTLDEMPSSDQLVVEQPISDELEQVSTNDREGNNVAFVTPVNGIEEVGTVLEEEASQPESTSLEAKPTVQVLDIYLQDTMGQDLDNGTLQVNNENKDPSVEAIQFSDNEVMDITQPYTDDESQIVESKDTSECDTEGLLPPAAMHVSDVDTNKRLQDMNISEGIFTDEMSISDLLGADLSLEVSSAKDMVVKDVDTDERLEDLNITEGTLIDEMPTPDLLGSEPTLEDSTTEDTDVKDVNVCEGTFVDETPTSDTLGSGPTLEVSTAKGVDVDMDERLQDLKFSEGTFVNGMPTSDILGAEPSLEVSVNECVDVKDAVSDERLQDMNISEGTLIDERPISDPFIAESTSEVSTTKDMDVKDVDIDEILQNMNISEDTLIDEPTLEASTNKEMDVMDVDMDGSLQDINININAGISVNKMPTSGSLGVEPTLEVLNTEASDVKDLAVEAELQLVSNDNMDDNLNADLMPSEPIVGEEVSQPHLTPVELKATMDVSDIKVLDATDQNPDAGDSYIEDVEESSHPLESQPVQDEGLKRSAHDPLLEAETTEDMVGSSESAEASEVERKEIYVTDNFLSSGAALLEHPIKVETMPILLLAANG